MDFGLHLVNPACWSVTQTCPKPLVASLTALLQSSGDIRKETGMNRSICLIFWLFFVVGCAGNLRLSNSEPNDTTNVPVGAKNSGDAALLSAFFGLDDAVPLPARILICRGSSGSDGMPVIFSTEIDLESLQAGDFRVVLEDGRSGQIACVTPAPATDNGEFRTILLIGDFGSADNQPARVEIQGNILSKDHRFNFRGRQVQVTRLEEGPRLMLAEVVPPDEWELGKSASILPFTGGDGCPESTRQVIRVVWDGGITKPGGDEIDDVERRAYRVFVSSDGDILQEISPIAVRDLGDGDNNHKLCLDSEARVVRVEFPAGLLTDPREDLNPATVVYLGG